MNEIRPDDNILRNFPQDARNEVGSIHLSITRACLAPRGDHWDNPGFFDENDLLIAAADIGYVLVGLENTLDQIQRSPPHQHLRPAPPWWIEKQRSNITDGFYKQRILKSMV